MTCHPGNKLSVDISTPRPRKPSTLEDHSTSSGAARPKSGEKAPPSRPTVPAEPAGEVGSGARIAALLGFDGTRTRWLSVTVVRIPDVASTCHRHDSPPAR